MNTATQVILCIRLKKSWRWLAIALYIINDTDDDAATTITAAAAAIIIIIIIIIIMRK